MEYLESMYYRKDTHKTSSKKKQTKRKRIVESKPENFEIVIENAETSEVKCFNVNELPANVKPELNNSAYNKDGLIFDKLLEEGHVNNSEYETARSEEENNINLDADALKMNIKNSRDCRHENDNEIKNEVEYCFDRNGNKITPVKRELSEPKFEDNALSDTDLWENDENVNHTNKTKLTDLEKAESSLWYIATGYDLDESEDSKSQFDHISPEQVEDKSSDSFDISDIKIKEESIRSIKEDDALYENSVFANTCDEPDPALDALNNERSFGFIKSCPQPPAIADFFTDNDYGINNKYTHKNKDSSITQMSTSCGKNHSWNQNVENTIIEKTNGNDFHAEKTEHLTEVRNGSGSDEKKCSSQYSSLFPHLTSAIRNNSGKTQTDKKLQHNWLSVKTESPEPASTSGQNLQNNKDVSAMAQTSRWREVDECPSFTEEENMKASRVKFTLKSRHSVHSRFNALGANSSEGNLLDKQSTSIATVNQLSNPQIGVNKNAMVSKTKAKPDFSQLNKSLTWSSCYGKVVPEKVAEMSSSDEEESLGKLIIDEEESKLLLSNAADDNNIDYNYVMLDGIMSLTITGSGELDKNSELKPDTIENKTVSKENEAASDKTHTSEDLESDSSAHRHGKSTHSCSPRKDASETEIETGDSHFRHGKSTQSCSPRKDASATEIETGDSHFIPSIKTEVVETGSDVINGDVKNCSKIRYQYCDDVKEEPSEIKIENYDSDTQDFDKSANVVAKVDESFISEFIDSVSFKETLSCNKPGCSKPATKDGKEFFEDSEDNDCIVNIKLKSDTERNRNLSKNNLDCTENEDDGENSKSSLRINLSLPESLKNKPNQYGENCEQESTEKYKPDSLHSSDNSACSSSESDNEDENSDEEVVFGSYRIIKRYFIDRCTGNTLQKILLRVKERKTYTDHELDDDEIEGKRSYKIEDKLRSDKYNKDYVKRLFGEEFNLRYLQENGLQYPILFSEKTGLGLRVPSDNFKVCDVKACVGSRRMLDVMDVNTQKGLEMTMKEWTRYYENTDRDRLLNVISLEFSHTKLENYVESPNLVREIDWVDTAWPQHLKDCQTESTNAIDKMKYPKVQKYCLMSVAGCYTDFHIDFGGTSVWYHILHGEKIFWLIPPTDKNLAKYENWVLSGKQGDAFLADSIEECQMIQLVAGNTFIIPSGWIHAVFTPKDSLVFGGNFLHSFNMVNQLKVSAIEDKTHVPMKFRYPFYAEINWYVLERYVHSLTGVTYLEKPQLNDDLEVINSKVERDQANFELLEEKLNKRLSVSLTRIDDTSPGRKSTSDDDSTASGPTRSPGQASTLPRTGRKSSSESANSLDLKSVDKPEIMKVPYKSPVKKKAKYVHLTKYELEGLIEVLGWVESLPPSKKGVPKDLIDPEAVLREVRRLIQEHMKDNPELAITGEPVLEWTKATKKLIKLKQKAKTAKLLGTHCAPKVKSAGGKNASGNRHRRVRCKKCEPCTRDDCMECNFCKDMRKYGGPGRAKQSCISRQCLAPILPKGIVCQICKMAQCLLDKPVKTDGAVDDDAEDYSSSLMECGICWEIVHPLCLRRKNENLNNDGVLNEDLPNSWKCSKCCFDGKEGKLMARVFKGGWRPTPASTPPPLSVSPPLQPQSPVGSQQVIVTEGKRVTLNQGIDSKKTMPKLSPSPEHRGIDIKPLNGSARGDTEGTFTPSLTPVQLKAETVDDDKSPVKMEVTDTLPAKKEPAEETFKVKTKRSSSPFEENPMKKKRNVSPSPSRPTKSSRVPGQSKSSPGSGRKSTKSATPDLATKRSKRETTQRSATRCTYDFDDDEEFMDISAPLPDKGKGKSIKGHKSLHLKTKDFSANLGSNGNNKSHTQTVEPKLEERGHLTKKSSEKLCSEQLRQTLISHIERRNLPVIKPQFVVRPAPMSPPDDYCVMSNGQKHPLSRKLWTYIFNFLSSADLARCQAVCQTWNRWCINPDLWKRIDLSKKRIVQTHLMGIVRRQPEYLDLSAVIMTQKQILWLLERIPLLKTLIVSKCSWATISGLCMSACPLLYKLDVSWATGLNDKCFEDLISPPVDRKPAVKNVSRLHRLKSLHLSGTEVTDSALELMTLHLSQLEELNISYCTRITDRGIQILASSKSPTQDSLRVLNISGCRGLTEVSLDAIKNFSRLRELYATNCIRIPVEKCRSLRHPRLKTFKY